MPLPDLNFRELIYDLQQFPKQAFFLAVESNLPCLHINSWSNLIFGSNTGFCQHNKYKIALTQHATLLLLQQREWQLTLACLSDRTLFQWTLSFSGSFFTGTCNSVCLPAFEIMIYNLSQSFLRTHLGVEAQGRPFNSLKFVRQFCLFVLFCFVFYFSL